MVAEDLMLGSRLLPGIPSSCVVANEFYASGMAKMAEQEGHPVDRAWVALRLAHFVAASVLSLLVGLERPGPGGVLEPGDFNHK